MVFETLGGDRPGLPSGVADALRASVYTVPASITVTLAVVFGAGLIALPAGVLLDAADTGGVVRAIPFAIFLALMVWISALLWPTVSVAVVERALPIRAARRSFELTKGSRGRLLGLLAVLFLGGFGVIFALQTGVSLWAAIASIDSLIDGSSTGGISALVWAVTALEWVFLMFCAVAASVAYHGLRTVVDGEPGRRSPPRPHGRPARTLIDHQIRPRGGEWRP